MTDLAAAQPYERRADAVILSGGDGDTAVRIAVRPSGTSRRSSPTSKFDARASTVIRRRPVRMPAALPKS